MTSTSQVRQLYVVTGLTDSTPSTEGNLQVLATPGNKELYFLHKGKGGLVHSDLIPVKLVRSLTQTPYAAMNTKLRSKTVTITGTPVVGQTYTLKVTFRNYIGMGDEDTTVRIGGFTVKNSSVTANALAAGLAASLEANMANENLAAVTVASNVITIKEVEQDWELGKFPVAVVAFEVTLGTIQENGIEHNEWGTVADGSTTTANDAIKKLADLEYFCMGDRASQDRMGGPYALESKMMINMGSTYDVINIHYAFQGEGVSVQFSEKDLHLLIPAGNTTILAAIKAIVGTDENQSAAIAALQNAVGDANSGLTKDVNDLKTTVGDETGGLVKDVAGKLDTPAAADITDGHGAAWAKDAENNVTIVDAGS